MSDKNSPEKSAPIEFEQAFAELEALVTRMEAGEQTLQKSIDDFQSTGILEAGPQAAGQYGPSTPAS